MGSRLEAKSTEIRKRIEKHRFDDEEGEEYEASKFGGFNDYFRRKKIKLQNRDAEVRSSTQHKPPIFRGVTAHVNGYTQPSLNDLHDLIVGYGGGFIQYLDGKTMVTHIIASNLTPKKKVEFAKYRIVKPAWVVDSIAAGKLLPWDAYKVVDEGPGQRVLGFDKGNVVSQANRNSGGYRHQTERSWYASQVRAVADELNSPHQDRPSTSFQRHAHGDIPEDAIKYAVDDRDSPCPPSDRQWERPGDSTHSIEPDQETPAADGNEKDDELDRPDRSFDIDLMPAVDEALKDSFTNRQDGLDEFSPKESIPDDAVQETEQQPRSASGSTPESDGQDLSVKGPEIASVQRKNYEDVQESDLRLDSPERAREGQDSISNVHSQKLEEMTPEEHNAALLADPKVWKSTVVNPGFLKQYYEESRLHHLSAWKAALKSQLQALASEKSASQKTKERRLPGARRYILHVDFDSFFAAVSLRKHPQYVEKPVVVAHGNGSGAEIASCNYPARKFGIKNGMWMKHAQKMCPDLKVLPYDFKAYEDASRSFYEAIIGTGGLVQSVSVDEALVDVSLDCIKAGGHDGRGIHEGSIWREQSKADNIAQGLRDQIKEKTGCAVSVGIGGNILLAKVALRKAKPAGQYHIKPEEALDFLGELTMQELPGIAYSIGGKLEEIGVKFVKDVRQLSKERMISVLGPKTGEKVWDYSRGIDRAEVGDQVIRKSVSAEVNWGIRFATQEQAEEFIQSLADELHKRLLNEGVKGKQLTMKIMRRAADAPLDPPKHLGHGKCDTFNKSLILGIATNDPSVLGREALSILKGFGFSPGELRGLGIQMQKLEPLKGSMTNPLDSSQKRLQFKTKSPNGRTLPVEDAVVDDIESPQKPKGPTTPHPAAAFARTRSPGGKPHTPLNTSGTQFLIPSQIDPEVLKELPNDIRSKFLPKDTKALLKTEPESSPSDRSRSTTPAPAPEALPTHSQIDKEALDALPADVRSEVLAYYAKSPKKLHDQRVLPQSPRKDRSVKLPKKLTTPTKKRGRPLGGGGLKAAASAYSTLTQSNFVANAQPSASKALADTAPDGNSADEIPGDFLSALPEDIKQEVLAQARRDRLQKKGGIDLTARKRRPPPSKPTSAGQRTLMLPQRPPKPTFTAQKFTKLPELRESMTAWYEEFRVEGPYAEDVNALVNYLAQVVKEEGDMEKAVSVTKWLGWVIDEGGAGKDVVWMQALERVQNGVQGAVRERGLGLVDF